MIPDQTVDVNGCVFTHQDILAVVDAFYRRVETDALLKVPFGSVEDWPEHIAKLTHFWWTRFGGKSYMDVEYSPPLKHYRAGFNREFLSRWLSLFHQTLQEKLTPDQAKMWKTIADRMGEGLSLKNDMMIERFGPLRDTSIPI